MPLAVLCSRCGLRPVDVAKKAWFLYGFLLFARYGSKIFVGCKKCVNEQVRGSLGLSAVGGWWCFPWGLGTPFVILQNLWLLVAPDSSLQSTMDEVLAAAGMDREELELDADGMSREQRRLLTNAYRVMASAIWADGNADPREMARAVEIIISFTGGAVGEGTARDELLRSKDLFPEVESASHESKADLFRMAADVVAVDGRVEPREAEYLRGLGDWLELPDDFIENVLSLLHGLPGGEGVRASDPALLRACEILGVEASTPFVELRRRYRTLMMTHHPDHAGAERQKQDEAAVTAQQINWAYAYMSGASK